MYRTTVTPEGDYDRAAIQRLAWLKAKGDRAELRFALREVWQIARQLRSSIIADRVRADMSAAERRRLEYLAAAVLAETAIPPRPIEAAQNYARAKLLGDLIASVQQARAA